MPVSIGNVSTYSPAASSTAKPIFSIGSDFFLKNYSPALGSTGMQTFSIGSDSGLVGENAT